MVNVEEVFVLQAIDTSVADLVVVIFGIELRNHWDEGKLVGVVGDDAV